MCMFSFCTHHSKIPGHRYERSIGVIFFFCYFYSPARPVARFCRHRRAGSFLDSVIRAVGGGRWAEGGGRLPGPGQCPSASSGLSAGGRRASLICKYVYRAGAGGRRAELLMPLRGDLFRPFVAPRCHGHAEETRRAEGTARSEGSSCVKIRRARILPRQNTPRACRRGRIGYLRCGE